jgi:hypothetical protein
MEISRALLGGMFAATTLTGPARAQAPAAEPPSPEAPTPAAGPVAPAKPEAAPPAARS